ncbi:ABC transporter substrate-binding protein [Denitromonas ohlonensis]|uniref:ABC transporter substrate-binding protein n=2 Tax=Denitromonas TaxID=139331 RepID=A0A557RPT3_9RHOO|nr:PhnD/SsuA/transferrin family substrate-binding protein [Denitromonas ohlonensis]TVO67163.1 ABC transporter substrate-binding protein [Denitromonas ohlonensis]TVO79223.1 ABC transporter substrate-binding protein [Denitromonas ohlonensis]
MARRLWWIVCVSVLMISAPAQAADKLARLVLAGPPAAVSFPLVRMLESGALADVADTVEFVLWRDPDQLRVLALNGKADVLAMPTNVAANLYNKGVPLQLLNVSTWGMLWLVSRDPAVRTLADLKGKEVAIPFRADMPDIVFSVLAEAQGIAPKRYFHLRYVASPLDAMQLLIMRRIDHALLAEPAVSMALRKTQSFPISVIAPELHRGVDLQVEWGKTFKREARMPQAGIVAMGAALKDPALAARVAEAYADALVWCGDHAVECGQAVARHVPQLMPEAVADSLAHSRLEAVSAQAARAELQFFFDRLMAKDPALIGGRLPDDGFYAPQ